LTIIRIRVHTTHMIVCVCKAVSDRHIRSAVKNGASTLRDLTRELGVGTCCGKCLPEAKSTLSASLEARGDCTVLTYFPQTSTEFAV
jgi:bacterioferritin-associated ferredoxin